MPPHLAFRSELRADDPRRVERLTTATGFFSAVEVGVAVELVEERLNRGPASGYAFLFAEDRAGQVVGYTCFGPIPMTQDSHDLYWIVVNPIWQGRGIGKTLLARTEDLVLEAGGRRVYIETSARGQYASTRHFYLAAGYRQAALLEDFYAPGDGKLIYVKALCRVPPSGVATSR